MLTEASTTDEQIEAINKKKEAVQKLIDGGNADAKT
jgi:hypothetical protein